MKSICCVTGRAFDITESDLEFYSMMGVPKPTIEPHERQRRRVAQGNLTNLYSRKCNFTGESIISNYHQENPHQVYALEVWYSDMWEPLSYAREYDFSKPFFEQYLELSLTVPKPALHKGFEYDENSDYTNYAGKNKDSYLIFDSDENRDCLYGFSINKSTNVIDSYRVRGSELCYECIDCKQCYGSCYLQDCENCSESYFLLNCIGCKNCIPSSNLRNKQYYILNQKVTKQQYEDWVAKWGSYAFLQEMLIQFKIIKINTPRRCIHGVQNENVIGDYVSHSKNALYCFDSDHLWDCKYVFQGFDTMKNCMDVQESGHAELLYETAFCGYESQDMKFCIHSLGQANNLEYCNYCPHSSNLFGCIGVRHKQYCILNKQYTKDAYFAMVERIKIHMKSTGEYGEFFPMWTSSFGYNETLAQEFYPETKERVIQLGGIWAEWVDELANTSHHQTYKIPDSIDQVNDDVFGEILICEQTGKPFRILRQELDLYRRMNIPLPRTHHTYRHKLRFDQRTPRHMLQRNCTTCNQNIWTTFDTSYADVRCEQCFRDSIV
jgi:hypothetical protein